ncbi:MAG: hypothetical protein NE327_13085 [Lentisphaeraceae bacterium]|nr:hypothetical protein [Lentisphaeraceae bacterium]
MNIKFTLLPFLFLLLCGNNIETIHDSHVNRTFSVQNIEGWNFRINVDVLKEKEWPTAKRIISNQLFSLKRFLKEEVVQDLQKVVIYVDIKQKGKSGAEYHPSKKWLIDNKFSPEKAKCIEISNISQFIRYTKTQPWVMLHELMHSYHDQVLKFDNKEILECFNNAIKAGKYGKVKHISGREVKHYSATNHKEYWSEACEAYFGTNDFYPFVKAEILEYDPDICKILKTLAK